MEPTEDWGNKSWTVDCVCGVNFDDGKEMVSCDECEVWVHTRCSRYVKSEKVFKCEKCKRKSKRGENIEDEVADSLLGMANKSVENVGSSRTTWTGKVPREERAHVQGMVGGESAGTGIFGSALWRASGYVHKKFGFQYKEFDWNDGNETGGNEGGGNELGSEGSNWGALSLLNNYKAGGVGGSVSFGAGKRTRDEESNKKKGEEGEEVNYWSSQQNRLKKDRSSMKSIMNYSGKHKKEDSRTFEDGSVAPHVKDLRNGYGSNGKMSVSCSKQNEAQVDINDSVRFPRVRCSPCVEKLDGLEHGPIPQKLSDLDKHTVAADCQTNGQLVGLENSHLIKESSSELEEVRHTREPSESCDATFISAGQLTKDKMVVSLWKSSSTSATTLLSGTKYSDCDKMSDAQNYKVRTQQKVVSEKKTNGKKDSSAGGFVKDRERYEKSTSSAKELPKSFASSVKTSNRSKISGSSNFSKTLSESKESIAFRSAKPSLLQNSIGNPVSCESASSLQPKSGSYIDNTTTTSKLMHRSKTVEGQPSSKVNLTLQEDQSSTLNTPATISDEELALLLHQELNRSVRVSRVPRMRHAGSLPQLASPTGASMLMKQSPSNSVGKDHGSVSKRKGKSVATEGTQNSQELQDESKNMKRSLLLPVQRTNDSARTENSVTKREVDNGSAPAIQSANKSNPPAASKQHVSSRCKSTQTASDDDSGTENRVTYRTLPGLLSEIVTKPMTYKELCDAVLPHWPHLRKKNGDRYAYSSHSQAVLDCLRSRKAWARLVDRGPKSNAGRKPRRSDAEGLSISIVESFIGHIPKGKRQMRKRRRELALQEGDLKSVDGDDVSSGEDSVSSSSSSGEMGLSSGDGGTGSNGGPSGVYASE
ncbi:uncharacterized protein LOC141692227 [Apium graveolens]|uniref:uncharacterized protein LOC141692227 n=1 Tax=Apium graveolens TaxID=4045 RepID=UPI003D78C504